MCEGSPASHWNTDTIGSDRWLQTRDNECERMLWQEYFSKRVVLYFTLIKMREARRQAVLEPIWMSAQSHSVGTSRVGVFISYLGSTSRLEEQRYPPRLNYSAWDVLPSTSSISARLPFFFFMWIERLNHKRCTLIDPIKTKQNQMCVHHGAFRGLFVTVDVLEIQQCRGAQMSENVVQSRW